MGCVCTNMGCRRRRISPEPTTNITNVVENNDPETSVKSQCSQPHIIIANTRANDQQNVTRARSKTHHQRSRADSCYAGVQWCRCTRCVQDAAATWPGSYLRNGSLLTERRTRCLLPHVIRVSAAEQKEMASPALSSCSEMEPRMRARMIRSSCKGTATPSVGLECESCLSTLSLSLVKITGVDGEHQSLLCYMCIQSMVVR